MDHRLVVLCITHIFGLNAIVDIEWQEAYKVNEYKAKACIE